MPTPFTHLALAQRLLTDALLPTAARALFTRERGAFLLGNIAADARVSSGLLREHTHFYTYDQPINEAPWRVMVREYPALWQPTSEAQQAFVAGYVAHLVMDAVWSLEIVRPYFFQAEWRTPEHRYLMLHLLLIYTDARDRAVLRSWQRETLAGTTPGGWLAFMSDDDLRGWRDVVARQLPPGESETLAMLGARVSRTPGELRGMLTSKEQMQADLWAYFPQDVLAWVEANAYDQARRDVAAYLGMNGT